MMRDFSRDLSALALNTATLGHNLDGYGAGWPPERVIDACAARGIGGIVFWRREIEGRAVEIGNRVRAAGMQVAGLCRTPYFTGPDAGSGDAIRASIDMAADLGAPVLTIVTGGTEPDMKGIASSQARLAERLARIDDHARGAGVRLALEPLNPMFGGNRTCLMTARDALDVCDAVGSDNIGVAIDVYHVWWDRTLAASLDGEGRRIFGFHLCDWLRDTAHMLLDRGMMGDGVADLRGLRAIVEGAGYAGPCEVEIFSAGNWWQRDPEEVLDVMVERFRTVC
jgi:sugar phosphate isomerase/epimerase